MKKLPVIALLLAVTGSVHAQTDGFGLGIIAGEPTGVCFKSWLSGSTALEGGAAWTFEGDGGVFLFADYVLHAFDIVDDTDADLDGLMFTYGLGGKLHFRDNEGPDDDEEIVIGLRIPLGLCYPFEGAPVDMFVQLAPVMDVVPETELGLNGGIGARLYF